MNRPEGHIIGEDSELRVTLDLISNGCRVSYTFGHAHPYDLIADTGEELLKIQVKTPQHVTDRKYKIELKDPKKYSADTVDLFAGYVSEEEFEIYIPYEEMEENSGKRHTVNFKPEDEFQNDYNFTEANHFQDYTFESARSKL